MQQMPQFGPLMQSIMALDSFDKRRREYKRVGWIYAARNPSFIGSMYRTVTGPRDTPINCWTSIA